MRQLRLGLPLSHPFDPALQNRQTTNQTKPSSFHVVKKECLVSRPAYSLEETLTEISSKAGKWYDSKIVYTRCDLFEKGYSIDAIDIDELTWISLLG